VIIRDGEPGGAAMVNHLRLAVFHWLQPTIARTAA
jgi:hypothetical protein